MPMAVFTWSCTY